MTDGISPEFVAPERVTTKLSQANRFFPSAGLLKRFHSLLLIKRPNAGHDIKCSQPTT
jgi:hypothetical protein